MVDVGILNVFDKIWVALPNTKKDLQVAGWVGRFPSLGLIVFYNPCSLI